MPPVAKQRSPRKVAALPKEMQSTGTSKPTQQAKTNQQAKGDAFLKYIQEYDDVLSARWGLVWASVPEEELTQVTIWGHFASYLCEVYVIPDGERNQGEGLKAKTAHGIWGGLIFQARGALANSVRQETKVCVCTRPSALRPSCHLRYVHDRSELARHAEICCCCALAGFLQEYR